jgi:hypothetical protein
VFLVVQDKAHVIAVIDRLDLWLRAILPPRRRRPSPARRAPLRVRSSAIRIS